MPAFTNQATLSYNDITTSSNIVQGNYTPQISLARSSVNAAYCADDLITMAVSIVNSCTSDCSGLNLTDDLGAYSHTSGTLTPLSYVDSSIQLYQNGVLQDPPAIAATAPLTLNNLSVPAGGNLLILYSLRANSHAPLGAGASITATSSLSGGCLASALSAPVTIESACGARLTISKSMCPSTVRCNEPVAYTLTIQNSGSTPALASDNVIVTDRFNPLLEITQVSFNGTSWQSPTNYSYNAATGVFASNAGQITVPAASYAQNAATGEWTLTPGTVSLTITGRITGEA